MNDDLEKMAIELERAAGELEIAKEHLLIAARHFRESKVPRGCAHTFASQGHLSIAQKILLERAEAHAAKAGIE